MASVVFMGTPEFAVPTLQALMAHHQVIGVVTQPDRPAGRGNQIHESPIKQVALAAGIAVFQPEKLRKKEAQDTLRLWQADVFVVAAFGQILPQAVLDMPAHGSINVHASLLPRWRGAAPIQACIRAGDARSGITIMKMDAGLDTGPVLAQRDLALAADETGQSLHDKLAHLGAELLIETLPRYLSGGLLPQPQPENGVTYAPQIQKEEGRIDWQASAVEIERLVRAFTPWPGTYTYWDGKMLKILKGAVHGAATSAHIGQVMLVDGQAAISTGEGLFLPQKVQLEGKKAMSMADFLRGYPQFGAAQL
ncbi:MAG: methionyl-tRNA formyltransferase [Chloroflexi bacterium]|nr:methionyl-tRNA formyltransferase [Chloroflexota bacterium]